MMKNPDPFRLFLLWLCLGPATGAVGAFGVSYITPLSGAEWIVAIVVAGPLWGAASGLAWNWAMSRIAVEREAVGPGYKVSRFQFQLAVFSALFFAALAALFVCTQYPPTSQPLWWVVLWPALLGGMALLELGVVGWYIAERRWRPPPKS